jgi:hypothetical protein
MYVGGKVGYCLVIEVVVGWLGGKQVKPDFA